MYGTRTYDRNGQNGVQITLFSLHIHRSSCSLYIYTTRLRCTTFALLKCFLERGTLPFLQISLHLRHTLSFGVSPWLWTHACMHTGQWTGTKLACVTISLIHISCLVAGLFTSSIYLYPNTMSHTRSVSMSVQWPLPSASELRISCPISTCSRKYFIA